MPNREEHKAIGSIGGPVASIALDQVRPRPRRRCSSKPALAGRAAASYFGGRVGAPLADLIDVPTSPRHRGFAHAVVPQGGFLWAVFGIILAWRNAWLDIADDLAECREREANPLIRLLLTVLEVGCGFVAEFPIGVVGGNMSHLLADAGTPDGLRFLGPGL